MSKTFRVLVFLMIAALLIAQQPVNTAQIAGTATSVNSGSKDNGTLRVVLATDQPQLTNKLLVTPDANSSVNVSQMNGVNVTMGNGTAGTGVQRVAIASDNSAVAGVGAAATGGAVPANAVYDAGNGSGNLTARLQCDGYAFYDASTNGATQLVALASSKIVYVCGYSITSSSATANTIKLVYGTGSNCATGQTAMTPGYVLQAAASTGPVGKVVPPNGSVSGLKTATSNALCVLTNAAQAAQVEVWYTQF